MKFHSLYIFLIFLFFTNSQLFAQGGNDPLAGQDSMVLENDRIIDIIDSDKPDIAIPIRSPQEPKTDEIKYSSKDYYIESEVVLPPVKPQSYQTPKPEKGKGRDTLRNNFVRVGFGKYVTPMADVMLSGGNKIMTYGLDFSHLSAHGDVIPLRNFRNDALALRATSVRGNNQFNVKLAAFNTAYFNYGGKFAGKDTISKDTLEKNSAIKDSLRNGFTKLDVLGELLHSAEDSKLSYSAGLRIWDIIKNKGKNLDLNKGGNELNITLSPSMSYRLAEGLKLGAITDFTYGLGTIRATENRFFMKVEPNVVYARKGIKAKAGVNVNYYANAADSLTQKNPLSILPIIEAQYEVIPAMLKVMLGYSGGMKYNTYFDIYSENRYISTANLVRPSVEKVNVYGGGSASLMKKLDLAAKVYFRKVSNQLMYVIAEDGRYFGLDYVDLNNFGIHIDGNYAFSKALRTGIAVDFNQYNTTTKINLYQGKFLQNPAFKTRLYGAYNWRNKLSVNSEIYFFGATPMTIAADNTIKSRKAFFDWDISADYRITKQISAFVQLNNIFASKYQRWWNYAERRFDVRAGMGFIF